MLQSTEKYEVRLCVRHSARTIAVGVATTNVKLLVELVVIVVGVGVATTHATSSASMSLIAPCPHESTSASIRCLGDVW